MEVESVHEGREEVKRGSKAKQQQEQVLRQPMTISTK